MNPLLRFVLCAALVLLAPLAGAAPPSQTINYQGYLTSSDGKPIDGKQRMTFRLYDDANVGTLLWTEIQPTVIVASGNFNVALGSVERFTLAFDMPYWLTVEINDDREMSPRQPLSTAPYAFRATTADALAPGVTISTAQLSGTIASSQFASTQLLPAIACGANQIPQWNGAAWICATGTAGPQGPQGPAGPQGPQGPAGSVDALTNLTLPPSTASAGNIFKGANRFIHNFGLNNTFIGEYAGNFYLTGDHNTAIGADTLYYNTTGYRNTASGKSALLSNTTGNLNTATGYIALASNTTGSVNTATGADALSSNSTGSQNTAIGMSALGNNTTGSYNTATGQGSLAYNTTGAANTADGLFALRNNTTGYNNTASGASALFSNTTGYNNAASGINALYSNTTGIENTASGVNALANNSTGNQNTASGTGALQGNTIGTFNTANGYQALRANTTGYYNTATGLNSLQSNVDGAQNVGVGVSALNGNVSGGYNTAIGNIALFNVTGTGNIGIGFNAGGNITTGGENIAIANIGDATDSGTIRIGRAGAQTRTFIAGISGITTGAAGVAVLVDSNGQLGTTSSSRRYKDDITDMGAASSALMNLRPVTFHYKTDQNPSGRTLQYGLIAEEVNEVYPGLVAHSADGQIETVMYQHLPPMLLNEFQKQQRTISAQAAELVRQRTRIAEIEQQASRLQTLERELFAIKSLLGVK